MMRYNSGSFLSSIKPVTKHLLIINILIWLASIVFEQKFNIDLFRQLALHYWKSDLFNPAQFFTYMFLHDKSSFVHVFCNMFSLFMFGSLVEHVLGSKRYLLYYIVCGLGAALVQELVWQFTLPEFFKALNPETGELVLVSAYDIPTVGASGAVFGILLAFGMIFPKMKMYIIPFPFPIQARFVVIGYGLLELFFGVTRSMDDVAHFAHLGGMIAGIIMILYWKHNGTINHGRTFY